MGLFSDILEKLGLKKPAEQVAPAPNGAAKPQVVTNQRPAPTTINTRPAPTPQYVTPTMKPTPVAVVDVVSKLEKLAAANPQKLDWKVSIVDMLKLLGIDSSLAARKELAVELGCPADKMGGDYSQMNIWLHKTVLQKIADNGGNIPQSLLN